MEIEKVFVDGFKGEIVSNLFFNRNSENLAIFFPGVGYNNDMPLLYYPTELLGQRNFDILRVDYKYNENEEFHNTSFEEMKEWIRADAIASVENILKKKEYTKIIIVCKSIGTIAGVETLSAIDQLQKAEMIWLTPLCHNEEIVNALQIKTNRSLIVIGTGDRCYVQENLDKLNEKDNYNVMEIQDADHSLEIKEDTIRSVQVMKDKCM